MFKSNRRGFTLAEVLVTVAIVAIIAAAVVPAVTSQISKGEETTAVAAVTSARSALTAFVSDVRAFPSRISYLTNAITTDSVIISEPPAAGVAFSTAQVNRWRGPYTTTATFPAGGLPLGFGGAVLLSPLVDSLNFVVATVLLPGTTVTTAQAQAFEALFDATSSLSLGMVRWLETTPGDVDNEHIKILLTSSR